MGRICRCGRVMGMNFADAERHALAQTLGTYGPEAPTLCEGWQARDLLEHLVMRERYPWSMVPGLQRFATGKRQQLAAQDFADLVACWEAKCYPRLSPRRLIDRRINGVEHWVHHEDVRRAQGLSARDLEPAAAGELAQSLQLLRFLVRNPHPVLLEPIGFARVEAARRRGVVAAGDNVVHVRGEVGEIVLWLFGRPSEVTLTGDTTQLRLSSL